LDWSAPSVTKTVYVVGVSASDSLNDQTLTATYSGSNLSQGTKTVTVVSVLLQPYTPSTTHFAPLPLPFAKARTNKVGIRLNGDTDNGGIVIDRAFNNVIPNENDLIRTDITISPQLTSTDSSLKYVLKKSSTKVTFWGASTKGSTPYSIPDAGKSIISGGTLWVEWRANAHATADLSIEAIETKTGNTVIKDEITYSTFTSVTNAFVGEHQTAGNRTVSPGVNDWVAGELSEGYDVHVWDDGHDWFSRDEADEWGRGPAYDELVNAVNYRGVNKLALIGYSHGGGTVYNVSWRINKNYEDSKGKTFLNTRQLVFTSYIDAVSNSNYFNPSEENRKPPGSLFHLNQYQENEFFTGGLSSADEEVDRSTLGVDHGTIDDNSTVQGLLKTRFEQKVTR
jgi:hypothetical protein